MITNTTKKAIDNPAAGLLDAMNIPAAEKRGQMECENSSQLPSTVGRDKDYDNVVAEYAKYGIKVIGPSKGDDLFLDVELPEGWKIKGTSHSMWNNLVDNNDRIRATFFYKAAFYDRDAFLRFTTRYSYNVVDYLPQEEKGHYETIKVKKVIKPNLRNGGERGEDGRYYYRNEWGDCVCYERERTEIVEEQQWVRKYKDSYAEYNATPHYFEIKDGDEIIFSTKDNPVFFKRKFKEDSKDTVRQKWWRDFEAVRENLRDEAKAYLDKNFPGWEDTTKHF